MNQGTGTTIEVCHNSTGNLMEEITTTNNSAGYNIFLAADNKAPAKLKTENESLTLGDTFLYTEGVLLLWTNKDGVNVSNGDVLDASIVSLAMADPVKAPYGLAAKQVMKSEKISDTETKWDAAQPKIGTFYDNIALTKTAIASGEKSAGFIAKSQVCKGGDVTIGKGYEAFPAGSYEEIKQEGIILNTGDTNLSAAFKEYLRGSDAQTVLVTDFCYKSIPTIPAGS